MSQLRCFVFTLNNYSHEDLNRLRGSVGAGKAFSYLLFGIEVGESGTPHLQGYAELCKKSRFGTVAGMFKWHIEHRNGTVQQACDYCRKTGVFEEYGVMRVQGARGDLDAARAAFHEGGMREVVRRGNAQAIRVAEKYAMYCEAVRDFKPTVTWLWGPSGVGKSRLAREMMEKEVGTDYFTTSDKKWFCGYDGHEGLIMDDWRTEDHAQFIRLLALLDRYECRVEYKGGSRQLLARVIIVTSILPPEHCIPAGEPAEQLLRRIDRVQELKPPAENIVPLVPEVGGVIVDPPTDREKLIRAIAELI